MPLTKSFHSACHHKKNHTKSGFACFFRLRLRQSTVANALDVKLTAEGRHTYILDGDNIRHGLNSGLGFSAEDRRENVRRVAEVARLMVDLGIIVLVPVIRWEGKGGGKGRRQVCAPAVWVLKRVEKRVVKRIEKSHPVRYGSSAEETWRKR